MLRRDHGFSAWKTQKQLAIAKSLLADIRDIILQRTDTGDILAWSSLMGFAGASRRISGDRFVFCNGSGATGIGRGATGLGHAFGQKFIPWVVKCWRWAWSRKGEAPAELPNSEALLRRATVEDLESGILLHF